MATHHFRKLWCGRCSLPPLRRFQSIFLQEGKLAEHCVGSGKLGNWRIKTALVSGLHRWEKVLEEGHIKKP